VYAGNPDADDDTGWSGGFTCVLANPPWSQVDFEDKKYFSAVEPTIAALAGQARKIRIAEWEEENPDESMRYRAARRKVKALFLFASASGVYPQCAEGLKAPGVNYLLTDQLFAERFAGLTAPTGRVGCIIPTAIATGAGGQFLFRELNRRGAITALYDFENQGQRFFSSVHPEYRFCIFSLAGKALSEPAAKFAFFLLDTSDLDNVDRVFMLTPEDIALINPNSRTVPIFRSRRDASITAAIYNRMPVLWDETEASGNLWGITFKHPFSMTDDADLFHTREQLQAEGWQLLGNAFVREGKRMLPLYESKMVQIYDHRWSSFYDTGNDDRRRLGLAEKKDPAVQAEPRYWIAEDGPIFTQRRGRDVRVPGVSERLAALDWDRGWLSGWRDVTNPNNERTAIPAFLPRAAVGYTLPLMFTDASPGLIAGLIAAQSSLVFDFTSRQKIGDRHMKIFVWKQLPVPGPGMLEPHLLFLVPRVLELVYTAYDMTLLARDLGDDREPFVWDEDRRALLRAELDAFFFRLYGIDERDDVDYILETFQTETGGLKHNEIAKYGTYRTKALVLDAYDRMAAADAGGVQYDTAITPPPGQGTRHRAKSAG
jgi:hypothetical protein